MADPFTDIGGRLLKVGDKVAFAALSYRSASLRTGEIVQLDERFGARVFNDYAKRRAWHTPRQLALISSGN